MKEEKMEQFVGQNVARQLGAVLVLAVIVAQVPWTASADTRGDTTERTRDRGAERLVEEAPTPETPESGTPEQKPIPPAGGGGISNSSGGDADTGGNSGGVVTTGDETVVVTVVNIGPTVSSNGTPEDDGEEEEVVPAVGETETRCDRRSLTGCEIPIPSRDR
jgi:hypothetical protein